MKLTPMVHPQPSTNLLLCLHMSTHDTVLNVHHPFQPLLEIKQNNTQLVITIILYRVIRVKGTHEDFKLLNR